MINSHTDDELDQFVDQLAIAYRAQRAYWHLRVAGARALPAVRRGLRHEHDEVRRLCCVLLDHLADEESFADLIAMLDDPAPRVRLHALHALACDRCKQGDCRPDGREVLPARSTSSPTIQIPTRGPWRSRWWGCGSTPMPRRRPRW